MKYNPGDGLNFYPHFVSHVMWNATEVTPLFFLKLSPEIYIVIDKKSKEAEERSFEHWTTKIVLLDWEPNSHRRLKIL